MSEPSDVELQAFQDAIRAAVVEGLSDEEVARLDAMPNSADLARKHSKDFLATVQRRQQRVAPVFAELLRLTADDPPDHCPDAEDRDGEQG